MNSLSLPAFTGNCERLIKFTASITSTSINADKWEEIIHASLKALNVPDLYWDSNSHMSGADIFIGNYGISAKSGKLSSTMIKLSSHRLTKFNDDINKMTEFIDDRNFKVYYCLARKKLTKITTYTIYKIDADVVNATTANWGRDKHGWIAGQTNGVVLKIIKAMSNQLWIDVPLSLATEVTKIIFNNDDLGVGLEKVANQEL